MQDSVNPLAGGPRAHIHRPRIRTSTARTGQLIAQAVRHRARRSQIFSKRVAYNVSMKEWYGRSSITSPASTNWMIPTDSVVADRLTWTR
jgi:hypothetical protein